MLPKAALRSILLVSLLGLLSTSQASTVTAGNNVWTSIGPEGGNIGSLAIDPATPTTLYAGAREGVYEISGFIYDTLSSHPIEGVEVRTDQGDIAYTDPSGVYAFEGLLAGRYTLTPSKAGYTFYPSSVSIDVPPDRLSVNFIAVPLASEGLVYVGPRYLPNKEVVIGEANNRITMGDHVKIRLLFKNNSQNAIVSPRVVIRGENLGNKDPNPSVLVHDGESWGFIKSIKLTTGILKPGEIGYADVWFFITNVDPDYRQSNFTWTGFTIETGTAETNVTIMTDFVYFNISGYEALKESSCIYTPRNFEIEKYSQYAAAPKTFSIQPSNAGDADTPEQAMRNLVSRVNTEFKYDETARNTSFWDVRESDVTLLQTRYSGIGVCQDFADLTNGLLKSIGFPTRNIKALLKKGDSSVGHAWGESYLGAAKDWNQADSTWNAAIDQQLIYDDNGYPVINVWADKNSLSTASRSAGPTYLCISACYVAPVNCSSCLKESSTFDLIRSIFPDLSCVEDVTSDYQRSSQKQNLMALSNSLSIGIDSSLLVTRTLPFALQTSVTNNSTSPVSEITVTVSTYEYIDSQAPVLDVSPTHHFISALAPSATVTVSWIVTPLVAGNGIPLRVSAQSGTFLSVAERPLVVNEPGSLPDLNLNGTCGLGVVSPGATLGLSANILNEYMSVLTDTLNAITATVYATPTLSFSNTVNLNYSEFSGAYQAAVSLPASAQVGTYQVDFVASRPGYESALTTNFFYVKPYISMTLGMNHATIDLTGVLTLTAQVFDRGSVVTHAFVLAAIDTPGGVVTIPLQLISGNEYTAMIRPVDLAFDLETSVLQGVWSIRAAAYHLDSEATAQSTITVTGGIFLPLIMRNYTSITADFTATILSGTVPLTVTFANTSRGTYTHSLWNFGDGLTSELISPTHTYSQTGGYTVTLTVSNTAETSTLSRANYITVTAPPTLTVDFSATPVSGTVPLTVTFANTSIGSYTSSLWNFGDGVTNTLKHPTHVYTRTGIYTVSLTVSKPTGSLVLPGDSNTLVRSGYITVTAVPPNLIINGGFETNAAWEFGNTPVPGGYVTNVVHTGLRSVRVGIEPPMPDQYTYSSVYQRITLPVTANRMTLSFWYWPRREGYLAAERPSVIPRAAVGQSVAAWEAMLTQDLQYVMLLDSHMQIIGTLINVIENDSGWRYATFDLPSYYAGVTLYVYFGVFNDGNFHDTRAWMNVDDVSLTVAPGASQIALPHDYPR